MLSSFSMLNTTLCSVAFNVYDVDRDGFISNGELFLVLKMMVGNNLKVYYCSVISRWKASRYRLPGSTTTTDC